MSLALDLVASPTLKRHAVKSTMTTKPTGRFNAALLNTPISPPEGTLRPRPQKVFVRTSLLTRGVNKPRGGLHVSPELFSSRLIYALLLNRIGSGCKGFRSLPAQVNLAFTLDRPGLIPR